MLSAAGWKSCIVPRSKKQKQRRNLARVSCRTGYVANGEYRGCVSVFGDLWRKPLPNARGSVTVALISQGLQSRERKRAENVPETVYAPEYPSPARC